MKLFAIFAFAAAVLLVFAHFEPQLAIELSSGARQVEQTIETAASSLVQKVSSPKTNAFFAAAAAYGNAPLELPERTKQTHCQIRGPLPDPECTPGAVFENATRDIICVKGYTKKVRNVDVATKRKIYGAYGLSYPQKPGAYEADHLIPLELGGSNEIANLFPEVDEPRPGYHEKDLVENYLNHEMCKGTISLAFAQKQIAENWLFVWESLSEDQIKALRSEYRN